MYKARCGDKIKVNGIVFTIVTIIKSKYANGFHSILFVDQNEEIHFWEQGIYGGELEPQAF